MTSRYKKLQKSTRLKQLVLPITAITITFTALLFITTNLVWNTYLIDAQNKAEESVRIITNDIAVTEEANRITDDYINNHMRFSCKTIAENTDLLSSAELTKMVQTLDIDFINIFDKENTIKTSTEPFHVGLVVGPEHLVSIMNNDESSAQYLVEKCRACIVTGNEYRYGYYKTNSGYIIQTGIATADLAPYISSNIVSDVIEQYRTQHNILEISYSLNKTTPGNDTDQQQTGINVGGVMARLNTGSRAYITQADINLPLLSGTLNITYDITSSYMTTQKHILYIIASLLAIYTMLVISITLHYRKNKRRVYLAYYDGITGLPNETSLTERIDHLIKYPARTKQAITIVGIAGLDLAKLKYGNEANDKIIRYVTKTLQTIENDRLTCFRHKQHGIVLLTSTYTASDLTRISAGISSMFNQPLQLDNNKFYVSVHYGTCMVGSTVSDKRTS